MITPRIHNKPFPEMTTQELREELAHWEWRIAESKNWSASVYAAKKFCRTIKAIIATREADKTVAA